MSNKKVLNSFRLNNVKEFIKTIDTTNYYLFTAKHTPYEEEPIISEPQDTEEYKAKVYREMLFGKLISNNDVSLVIPRYEWSSNTVYTQYDDIDTNLFTKTFYVYVTEGDNYHTFKCLYNNNGNPSTVKPDFSSVDINDEFYETSDGYTWKYMYTVNSNDVLKFATSDYFPVVTNTEISSVAVKGAIDVIKVVNSGNNYTNYLSGENKFNSNQLRINSNTRIYDISSSSLASSNNDFYNGCYIYIKSGEGLGQYKKIVDYIANSTNKAIILESEFANTITIDSVYDIYPGVEIYSDGLQTSNAVARAIINSYSNTVNNIQILNRGSGYNIATANVVVHPSVNANNAELRVINSPYNGHGFDAPSELGCNTFCISVTFSNNESNTIPTLNDYRTIGLLKNPKFANVSIEYKTKNGEPLNGEKVLKIKNILINSNTIFSVDTNTITAQNSDFLNQYQEGDYVLINKGINYHISTVNNIINSTSLIMNSNVAFEANNAFPANLYVVNVLSDSYVISANASHINLANVYSYINTNDKFIGLNSKAYFIANSTTISGENKNIDTFINMTRLNGTILSGSFEEDEIVYQSDISTTNSIFYGTEVKDSIRSIYLTNVYGDFQVEKTITGNTSLAVASINNKYDPEIVFKSGDILYLENIDSVERNDSQSEKFKLIFEL